LWSACASTEKPRLPEAAALYWLSTKAGESTSGTLWREIRNEAIVRDYKLNAPNKQIVK